MVKEVGIYYDSATALFSHATVLNIHGFVSGSDEGEPYEQCDGHEHQERNETDPSSSTQSRQTPKHEAGYPAIHVNVTVRVNNRPVRLDQICSDDARRSLNRGCQVPGITTFVHFSMPKENIDEFLSTWSEIKDFMLQQPGAISGIIHRSIDVDSPFQLINVARWESPEALGRALRASREEFKRRGKDLAELFKRLGVQISQNNYVEEVKY